MHGDELALFISVRPRFAEMLLDGTKTSEVRRTAPAVRPGTKVYVYASSPVRALLGEGIVDRVVVGDVDMVWRRHGGATGLTRREYDDYLAGATAAVIILLRRLRRLESAVPLDELRRGRSWFRPPQSFRYLRGSELASMDFS